MTKSREHIEKIKDKIVKDAMQLDCVQTRKGLIPLKTYKNILIYLDTNENTHSLYQYNNFSSRVEITRQPPWKTIGMFPKSMEDCDVLELKTFLIKEYNVEFPSKVLNEGIDAYSRLKAYNPVLNYLKSLEWDKNNRVINLLSHYFSAEDNEYTRYLSKMTMNAACARVDKPGVKYDYMLILEGRQGIGKSFGLEILGAPWHRNVSLTDRTKDTVDKMQGAWIIEVAEMAAFKKKDIESIKSFITNSNDAERLSYGRRTQQFPRQSIFVGTINPDNHGYLSDATGNRRFLPVECQDYIKFKDLRRDRDQLWAEAWQIYKDGFPMYIGIGSREEQMAIDEQRNREIMDDWQELIQQYVGDDNKVRGVDIWTECLKGFSSDFDNFKQRRIAQCMSKLGWIKKNIRKEGKVFSGYYNPNYPTDATPDPWKSNGKEN